MPDGAAALTPAQRRILADVRAAGVKTYNGRARRQITALEAAGLVDVEWDMHPQPKGGGINLVWRITVRPRAATEEAAPSE